MSQNSNKIIRTICYFTDNPSETNLNFLEGLVKTFSKKGYEIQTKRICSNSIETILSFDEKFAGASCIFSVGTLSYDKVSAQLDRLLNTKDTSFNIDLTKEIITPTQVQVLFDIIKKNADKTFNFTYVFNNSPLTPFFPSASYVKKGFSIGMQPTDLSDGCQTLDEWFQKIAQAWREIDDEFKKNEEFLGIDSSIASLFEGKSSLVGFIKRLGFDFSHSATTDVYLKITNFLKEKNPKAVGLCGLMFPCLEDFELADEYEKGNFSIERNIYLSLHSGVGIDTYPIGIDEKPERVLEILNLVQGLSNKHKKPLSVRFVSDGKAKVGTKTDFKNQYLKDVVIRGL